MESLMLAHGGLERVGPFLPLLIVFYVFFVLTVITMKGLICCRIFSKAGFSWALGLLMLVPLADIIMAFVLAFSEWPIQRQVRRATGPHAG